MSSITAALMLAALVIGPAPGNSDVVRLVATEHVSTDWLPLELPPVPPGFPPPPEDILVRLDGVAHVNLLLLNTSDPGTVRFAAHSFWHGFIGIRFTDPVLGFVEASFDAATSQSSATGTISFVDLTADLLIRSKVVGTISITVAGVILSMELNVHLLIKIVDGEIEWIKIGVPRPIAPP